MQLYLSMVIGGMDSKRRYLDDVEMFAPGLPCHHLKLPPYPMKIVGATGNLASSGKVVICGGAQQKYMDVRKKSQYNLECVSLGGGSQWCFGPKTKDCYTYKYIIQIA